MLAEVGTVLIGLALAAAAYAAFAAFWSIRRADARWEESSRNGMYATTALLALALLALLATFLDDQFQIRYVAQHSNKALPPYLKASAVWAGQEGSLLLWSFLQALFAALVVSHPSRQARPLIPWTSTCLGFITAFFTGVTLFLSNPFTQSVAMPADGYGLNPLLRHPGMVFHPPALYLGYVGLAVPFALAVAALITRQVNIWAAAARRWTLAAWLFLGLGILLGMRWAYDVLGWGGYWGWDPVENAGLLPWLTATALLHGTVMQKQRGSFRVWNLLLAIFSFVLVLLGTFTTRSGLVQSVHAFARSRLGLYFAAAIGLALGGPLILVASHRATLFNREQPERLLSRDGMFLLSVIILLTITGSVLVGSYLPTLTGGRFEASPSWFDRVTGPQFAALVFVMGLCPLLGHAAAAVRRLPKRGWPALLGASLVTGVAALVGFTQPLPLVGFAIVGLAGGTTVAEMITGARSGQRRRRGSYLVHAGVILIAAGVVGTRTYASEKSVVLSPGQPVDVGEYTVILEDLWQEPTDDRMATQASLSVYRNEAYLTTLQPRLDQYVSFDQAVTVPALRTGLREDLYVILAGWTEEGTTATFKLFLNPLASFLWLGGLALLAGGALTLWPPSSPTQQPAPKVRRRAIWTTTGLAAGLLALLAAGVAMWGIGSGTTALTARRPRFGEPAPNFSLSLLDGSALTLSGLQGQAAVVNFWTTWCVSCEEELPDLQAVWEDYRAQEVIFVGIASQEEKVEVQEMASRFGLTYPVGLDPEGRIAIAYGITGVPETFVVDADGRVTYVHVGPVNAEQLRDELDSLLQE
jgi:cytochrome c-type biogenesis protein CcmF